MRDEQLLAYLKGSCSGRKNRVGGTELERTLHVSGTDLRKLVNQLRRKTHPIASDRNGYFYATTAGEVYDTIRQLKRMAAGTLNQHWPVAIPAAMSVLPTPVENAPSAP